MPRTTGYKLSSAQMAEVRRLADNGHPASQIIRDMALPVHLRTIQRLVRQRRERNIEGDPGMIAIAAAIHDLADAIRTMGRQIG